MQKNNIKALRVEHDMSQTELAEKLHVHQTAVSQWEKGKTNPDMQTADLLAGLFKVSVDYLLGRTNERSNSYYASNIKDSHLVQGNGSLVVGANFKISKDEAEILRIYRESGISGKARIFSLLTELDEENNADEQ